MKLKSFKEMIAMSKEKLDEALAPIRARQVKAKADQKMADIDAKLVEYEATVTEMCTDKDIDLDVLVDTLDEVALLERRKGVLAKVVEEMFPA